MNAQSVLPNLPTNLQQQLRAPSLRNRTIFRAVKLDHRTLRDVAQEFHMTFQRVSDIVRQVTQWLVYTGGHAELCDWRERVCVAEFLHRERLDQLVDNCLRNFRETPKELVTRKEVKIKGEVHREEVSRREILPNPRWYDIAARVVQARMKFDDENGSLDALEPEEMSEGETFLETRRLQTLHEQAAATRAAEAAARAEQEAMRLKEEAARRAEEEARAAEAEAARQAEEEARVLKEQEEAGYQLASDAADSEMSTAGQIPTNLATEVANISPAILSLAPALANQPADNLSACDLQIEVGGTTQTFQWYYATEDDLSETRRRERNQERIDAALRRKKFLVICSGPPLEVRKGIFIVIDPFTPHDNEQRLLKAAWLRREAAVKAAGGWWPTLPACQEYPRQRSG